MNKKTVIIASAIALGLVAGTAGITWAVTKPDQDFLSGDTLQRASASALAEVGAGTVTSAERTDDGGPAYELSVRLGNGDQVEVELNEAFVVVWVSDLERNDDDGYVPTGAPSIPGTVPTADPNSDRASAEAAALGAVGSGRVTEFDRSDDADHAYEVEITLPDGTDVDVELDASFVVVSLDGVRR